MTPADLPALTFASVLIGDFEKEIAKAINANSEQHRIAILRALHLRSRKAREHLAVQIARRTVRDCQGERPKLRVVETAP